MKNKLYLLLTVAIATFILLGITAGGRADQPKPPVKVLVVSGLEYHNWRETAPQIVAQLASSPNIDVTLDTNINVLCTDEIFNYDVMFFNFVNMKEYDSTLNDELALDNIEKFLNNGGGIVIFHLAIGIFERDFPKRAESIIGKYYDRSLPPHDPFREFDVKIIDKEHPITKNLSDFQIEDELYTCLGENDNEIEVLATAYSINVKADYPMAHLFKFGKGTVFTTVLGHDTRALQSEGFVTLLRNAVLWLAKRDVPVEPMKAVPAARPIVDGQHFPPVKEEINNRIAQVEKQLPENEKLLVYADCGREWVKKAQTGESISVTGIPHLFPGSIDVWEAEMPQCYVVSGTPIKLEIANLQQEKKYRFYVSWWDFDNGKRMQSVSLVSKDGAKSINALDSVPLPAYHGAGKLAEACSFDIADELVKLGTIECRIDKTGGPNAVISEAWLVEIKPISE